MVGRGEEGMSDENNNGENGYGKEDLGELTALKSEGGRRGGCSRHQVVVFVLWHARRLKAPHSDVKVRESVDSDKDAETAQRS